MRLTPESLIVAVKNIARRLGDDISDEKPILDSRLPDGSRVAAVLPPCSIHGVALTIRKFNSHKFKMKDLIEVGTVTAELAEQLEECVAQRKNILICGATSSGKTTLANILTDFIPNHERIVLIEDTAEIQIQKGKCPSIRSPARAKWPARCDDPRSSKSNLAAPARQNHLGRNSRR